MTWSIQKAFFFREAFPQTKFQKHKIRKDGTVSVFRSTDTEKRFEREKTKTIN